MGSSTRVQPLPFHPGTVRVPPTAAAASFAVARLSEAWQASDWNTVAAALHADVVFVQPGSQASIRGRDACADTYRQFLASNTITAYTESDHHMEFWPGMAVSTSRFAMRWEADGSAFDECGREVLVLRYADGAWRVVWRTLTGDPSGAPSGA